MAESIDMSQVIDLTGVKAIKDWVDAHYLLKSEAEKMMASKIKLSFGSDFIGQSYTVTGGANETYTGLVPDSRIVMLTIKELNTTYTVVCATNEGTSYERDVVIDSYYGIYPFEFLSFLAYLEVKADPGATITATGSKKTYTGVADMKGLCTLNIGAADTYSVTATLNGETTQPVTATVTTAGETYNCTCPSLLLTIVSWTDGTDDEIAAMIDAARTGTIDLQTDAGWAVGDVRTIQTKEFTDEYPTVHVSQSIDIVISSFEDYNKCGCVLQFDFKDSLEKGARMNISNTNAGGYKASEMFTVMLPRLAEALPTWLSSRLLEFDVLASAGSQSSTIETIKGNKLALRSEIEIFGTTTYSRAGEGTQIEYYKTAANRVKKKGHNGSASFWWERSPGASSSGYFCRVDSSGSASSHYASSTYGVAPFGCI